MSNTQATSNPHLLDDFPDHLSPMLVKELRQGLRTKTFTSVFIGIQVVMVFVMLILTESTRTSGGETLSAFTIGLFGLVALVIQPFRATGTLEAERKQKTLELATLTQLSPWKIVLGKWLSLCGQTTVLFIAILPYLVLRYFIGGMDLFNELAIAFLLLITSYALTAITIGLSSTQTVLLRTFTPLIFLPTFYTASLRFLFSEKSRFNLPDIFVITFFVCLVIYTFLEIACDSVSSRNESRTLIKRSVALCAALISATAILIDADNLKMVFTLPIISLLTLTEKPAFFGLHQKGLKRAFLSKGWHNGLITFFICTTIIFLSILKETLNRDTLAVVTFLYGCLFPHLLLSFSKHGNKGRINLTLLIWAVYIAVAIISERLFDAFSISNETTLAQITSIIPFACIDILSRAPSNTLQQSLWIQVGFCLVATIIIGISAIRQRNKLQQEYIALYSEEADDI